MVLTRLFDQIFGLGFDQASGEGKNHKYNVQYYPPLRKKHEKLKNMTENGEKHLKTIEQLLLKGLFSRIICQKVLTRVPGRKNHKYSV